MTLDEQLRRAFDTLAARLRDDVEGHARSVMEGLITTAEAERADAVAQAARDAWAAAERDAVGRYEAGLADLRAGAERESASHEAALAEARAHAEREHASHYEAGIAAGAADGKAQAFSEFKQSSGTASVRLVDAIRAMDRAHSLSDILDLLVNSAAAEAPRAGVFLTEGARLRSWRCVGFDAPAEESGAIVLETPDAGILADAAATAEVVKAGEGSPFRAPAFAGLSPDRSAIAVPMEMSGQVFAVVYADEGDEESHRHTWPPAVELLTRYAARCLEVQTATRLVQAEHRV